MKTIVVEDNAFDRQIIKKFVQEDSELDLKGEFGSAIEAISVIKSIKPDLVLLDVEMPHMTGFEFIQSLEEVPLIILITSHESYAMDAFENDVIDFIVKPPTKERFKKAISKAKLLNSWLSLEAEDDRSIFVRVDREDIKVFLKDILFIEATGDYVKIYTKDEKYMVLTSMKAIGTKLPKEEFVRVHRSFIVNASNIDVVSGDVIKIGGKEISMSRAGKRLLKESNLI